MQFFLSSWVPMCVALISVAACNSFRDSHQLRITYGSPDLQSFLILCLASPEETIFCLNFECLPCFTSSTRDGCLRNHIQQEAHPAAGWTSQQSSTAFLLPLFPASLECSLSVHLQVSAAIDAYCFLKSGSLSGFFIPQRSFPFPQPFLLTVWPRQIIFSEF